MPFNIFSSRSKWRREVGNSPISGPDIRLFESCKDSNFGGQTCGRMPCIVLEDTSTCRSSGSAASSIGRLPTRLLRGI